MSFSLSLSLINIVAILSAVISAAKSSSNTI